MPIFLMLSVVTAIPMAAVIGYKAARNAPAGGSGLDGILRITVPTQAAVAAEKRKVNLMALALGAAVAYKTYKVR